MPNATPTSNQRTPSDDATRVDPARNEGAPQKPVTRTPEPVDAADDPYDNVACTD